MANGLVNLVQGVLGRAGLRVVKWPRLATDRASEGGGGVPGRAAGGLAGGGEFFPVGRVGPWVVPADLRADTRAWARELVSVYDDPASWPSSIVPEGGLLLHALVRNIQPRTIVETGTCLGVSTIWMASAVDAAAKVFTFDDYRDPPDERLAASSLFQNRRAGVAARFERAGVAGVVEAIAGDSKTELAARCGMLRSRGGVHLAFIDGDHSPAGAAADFRAVEPALCVGGFVVLHDTFPNVCNHVGPRWLIDNLASVATGRYQVCDLYTAQTNYGLTILRRIG